MSEACAEPEPSDMAGFAARSPPSVVIDSSDGGPISLGKVAVDRHSHFGQRPLIGAFPNVALFLIILGGTAGNTSEAE
ncbi:MAG: hypothetical protein U1E81_22860 [Xanthobacteraceae bacterium]